MGFPLGAGPDTSPRPRLPYLTPWRDPRSHGARQALVDLGQRQRSSGNRVMFGRTRAAPVTLEGGPPCIRGNVFRSNQRQLQGLLPAHCWGLQVSLSIQRQPARSCTASTSAILPVASRGRASCSGRVRWHGLRSVITPAATQMAVSIALGCGGKGLVGGPEPLAAAGTPRLVTAIVSLPRNGDWTRQLAHSDHEAATRCMVRLAADPTERLATLPVGPEVSDRAMRKSILCPRCRDH
jgi:hypothetical protein